MIIGSGFRRKNIKMAVIEYEFNGCLRSDEDEAELMNYYEQDREYLTYARNGYLKDGK